MIVKPAKSKNNSNLEQLGQKIEQLIELCNSLSKKNQALTSENLQIKTEQKALITKTNIAQDRVRNIIDEIKNMERQA